MSLNVKGLSISFGGLKAVNNFAINIEKGQLYGLIGPNRANRPILTLTGVYKPDTGTILLDGQNLTGKSTTDINKAGIARTFQNIRLFKDLSVLDNVKAGLHNHTTCHFRNLLPRGTTRWKKRWTKRPWNS